MFIQFTQPGGEPVLINADHIVRAYPADKGGCGLKLSVNAEHHSNYIVQESFETVKNLLANLVRR